MGKGSFGSDERETEYERDDDGEEDGPERRKAELRRGCSLSKI